MRFNPVTNSWAGGGGEVFPIEEKIEQKKRAVGVFLLSRLG
jgi:hypothetical protein